MSRRNKKVLLVYLIVLIVIISGIGYAYLNQDLSIENSISLNSYTAEPDCPNNLNKTFSNGVVCKRAEKLHKTTCQYTSGTSGCLNSATGYTTGSEITYGSCGTEITLTVGDAFDCDVNNNKIVDVDSKGNSTERFYYVSDMMYYDNGVKYDSDYATLIYYSNVENKVANPSSTLAYYTADENWHGASSAFMSNMPTSTDWINTLKRDSNGNCYRQIVDANGATSGSVNTYENYNYTSYGARLLTYQEVVNSCGGYNNLSTNCEFLMENTSYEVGSGVYGYWLDTPNTYYSNLEWRVYGADCNMRSSNVSASTAYGLRPAIEVPKTSISLK